MKFNLFALLLTVFLSVGAQVNLEVIRNTSISDLTTEQLLAIKYKIEEDNISPLQMKEFAIINNIPTIKVDQLLVALKNVEEKPEKTIKTEEVDSDSSLYNYANNYLNKTITNRSNIKRSDVFGHTLFSSQNVSSSQTKFTTPPQNYILQAGDRMEIVIWGSSQQEINTTVKNNGSINLGRAGVVSVAGKTLSESERVIRGRLALYYPTRQGQASISISLEASSTPITVSVIGEVEQPGTFTLGKFSTIVNGLSAAGGPNDIGSYRSVDLIRGGKIFKKVDLYKILVGDDVSPTYLQNNDIIRVKVNNRKIRVQGGAKRTGQFELNDDENLSELIDYFGGFTTDAIINEIQIKRREGTDSKFISISQENFDNTKLIDGDQVIVREIQSRKSNSIEIQGPVYLPGEYSYKEGLTLFDVIQSANSLTDDAYLKHGLIIRDSIQGVQKTVIGFNLMDVIKKDTNIQLMPKDQIRLFSKNEIKEDFHVDIHGRCLMPGKYPYFNKMTLFDLVMISGGLLRSASNSKIEVSRSIIGADYNESQLAEVYSFPISSDLELSSDAKNFVLEPDDNVVVRQSSSYEPKTHITIKGEVAYPGLYTLSTHDEKITDIITRAGGLTKFAYTKGVKVIRKIKISSVEREQKKLILLNEGVEKRQALQQYEFISLDLHELLKNPKSEGNITLLPGDEIIIPKKLETVRISGEVLHPSSTRFTGNKSTRHYISTAGGFNSQAQKRKTFVVYANGSAKKTSKFLFINFYPRIESGAEIIVPEKPDRNRITPQSAALIASALGTLTTAIVSILSLSRQ